MKDQKSMMYDPELDGDEIVAVPRPAWKLLICGLLALAFFLYASIRLYNLLTHDPAVVPSRHSWVMATGPMRWVYIGLYSVFAMLPLCGMAYYVRTPELAIDKIGIRGLDRRRNSGDRARKLSTPTTLSWEQINYCCWGQYSPGVLNIQSNDERYFVKIPDRFRVRVEKAIRGFGKWEG